MSSLHMYVNRIIQFSLHVGIVPAGQPALRVDV